ncbi:hypothetical protein CK203_113249 [Vitis vinifera]|uniref:Uncharacterized protein n=1 Tax=Vitis vinifera TaxID=29760 RepID=A0A438CCV5_VITVI|nr:hypothetical protein CK203_113249 [Vitis vinifera]
MRGETEEIWQGAFHLAKIAFWQGTLPCLANGYPFVCARPLEIQAYKMPRARNRLTTRPRQTTRSSPLSHGNVTGERAAIYPTVGLECHNVSLIQEFKALTPPIFQGGLNFLEAENWMKEITKILDVMAMPEERRVSLTFFMLRDEAETGGI